MEALAIRWRPWLIVEENVEPKTAQGILRHTDTGLTISIYTHAQDPGKRERRRNLSRGCSTRR
jgi:hypothetical protein